jgi:hypothetical protein
MAHERHLAQVDGVLARHAGVYGRLCDAPRRDVALHALADEIEQPRPRAAGLADARGDAVRVAVHVEEQAIRRKLAREGERPLEEDRWGALILLELAQDGGGLVLVGIDVRVDPQQEPLGGDHVQPRPQILHLGARGDGCARHSVIPP